MSKTTKKFIELFWKYFNQTNKGLENLAGKIPDFISPNFLTFLRLILTFPIVLFTLQNRYLPATAFFIAAFFLDVLDGALARVKHKITKFGKFFDPFCDKAVFLVILFILGINLLPKTLLYAIYFTELLVMLLALVFKPLANVLGFTVKMGANIQGKIKMFLQTLGIVYLFFAINFHLNIFPAVIILALAVVYSSLSILKHFLAVERNKK